MLDSIAKSMLFQVAGLEDLPTSGAFNIRLNGQSAARSSSPNVQILPKADKPGINILIKPGTKETIHIPVVISESGVKETVPVRMGSSVNGVASARRRPCEAIMRCAPKTASVPLSPMPASA